MKIAALVGFILISLAAGAIGSIATSQNIPTWYQQLEKPALNPPNWVFGPVWTTLYIFMGTAAWLVWQKAPDWRPPMALFAVQLVLNTLWSIIFFGMRNPGGALIEIVFLWLSITATMLVFFRYSAVAGALFIPYLAWVSFASYLNYMVWRLNS